MSELPKSHMQGAASKRRVLGTMLAMLVSVFNVSLKGLGVVRRAKVTPYIMLLVAATIVILFVVFRVRDSAILVASIMGVVYLHLLIWTPPLIKYLGHDRLKRLLESEQLVAIPLTTSSEHPASCPSCTHISRHVHFKEVIDTSKGEKLASVYAHSKLSLKLANDLWFSWLKGFFSVVITITIAGVLKMASSQGHEQTAAFHFDFGKAAVSAFVTAFKLWGSVDTCYWLGKENSKLTLG